MPRYLVFVVVLVSGWFLLGPNTMICAHADSCDIPSYYQGSWDVVGSNKVTIKLARTQVLSTTEGQVQRTYDCVESKGNIVLLRTILDDAGADGVICLLFGEMADAGVTMDRLNPVPVNGNVMDPQTVGTNVSVTIEDICRLEKQSNVNTVYIKRKRPGVCRFPEAFRGTWNSTLSGTDHVILERRRIIFVFIGGFSLNLTCEFRDRDRYLLRTNTVIMKNTDGYMCVTMTTLPRGKRRISILQNGQFWNDAVTTVQHLQPLLLARDCPMTSFPVINVILQQKGI